MSRRHSANHHHSNNNNNNNNKNNPYQDHNHIWNEKMPPVSRRRNSHDAGGEELLYPFVSKSSNIQQQSVSSPGSLMMDASSNSGSNRHHHHHHHHPPLHHAESLVLPSGSHDPHYYHHPSMSHRSSTTKAHLPVLPGKTIMTRRKREKPKSKYGRYYHNSFCHRLYVHWIQNSINNNQCWDVCQQYGSLIVAIVLWYCLGVFSIGTSKVLLSNHALGSSIGNVPPCYLTFQQLLLGSTILKLLLKHSYISTTGIQPWPRNAQSSSSSSSSAAAAAAAASTTNGNAERRYKKAIHDNTPNDEKGDVNEDSAWNPRFVWKHVDRSLVLSALFFALGFYATNIGFAKSAASFVETIKASEPITSASIAVWWGIEVLSIPEICSLLAIVAGVLLSTLGNPQAASSSSTTTTALSTSLLACSIVMASNLCFSFRGLYQKLFRATPQGHTSVVDDLNLQYRMQQLGVTLLLVPTVIFDGRSIVQSLWQQLFQHNGSMTLVLRYVSLALLNGCAFTGYNLSSTYILSRISVVHHAALNCIRRIFAIIVTSLVFGVPITLLGALGIVVSVVGFLSFSHYKVQKQHKKQQHPLSHSDASSKC